MRKPRRAPPRPARNPAPSRTVELTVDQVGARGDGIARLDGETVFVPFTVAGDRVLARVEGKRGDGLTAALIEVLEPGPGRATPPCAHYGRCGGCSLQHLDDALYAEWKRDLLVTQLARQGLAEAIVEPLVRIPPASRRRATFAFTRAKGAIVLGFNGRASHTVVDIERCPLLDPALGDALPGLRKLLGGIAIEGGGDLTLTLTEGGLDVLVEAPARLDLFERETLAEAAASLDLARLHWRRPGTGLVEPIARRRAALVHFGGIAVEPAPGGFLQPTRGGELAIAEAILSATPKDVPVADLYSGCGSFSLPLALRGPVRAVEGEQGPVAALEAAARAASLPLTAEVRDLARRPLAAHELKGFRAIVLDPPRAGAAAQAAELARPSPGGPTTIAMVSCNPATLARDLRTLCDGGWRIKRVVPIDQFPWSAHLEAVATLCL
ncbi:class I SAM-dependent RNA methyltransferase [Paramagnetospirillum magneticum]|uniref:SAM-dependent methyltransferase related to tRNA (Uracil-5-)-methyltransferase n=1 Tax=Paramagnetospirillum magneticum (strain ATCC 700264 / AMB-1) TaxID=342108 RepID=Q2WAJ3_PARM1|nr:TRAM domain-containing protein [Paramagnetospirillum magneticum]BAE49132.1 SAM-dependent methyltransferase related to tRNA (uracil-5-)-methyltransferase [Paramagnetospirillum magneticum AMB-1]